MDRGALSGRRVLDLSDASGMFCGMMLACYDAEVIKVELPGGDKERRWGPFYGDIEDPERSLFWEAYNLNKKGVTLNLESSEGIQLFRRLVERADFVIESFPRGYLAKLGLDYSQLLAIKPDLIMVSITPFGQEGPYSTYITCDLVSQAMGGFMFHCGDERGPVRITCPQTYSLAGSFAASACLVAEWHRLDTGEGQYIDLSMHESVIQVPLVEIAFWQFGNRIVGRYGHRVPRENVFQRYIWQCKDGKVCFRILGGSYGRRTRGLAEWAMEENLKKGLEGVNWEDFDLGGLTQEEMDIMEDTLAQFFRSKTKQELHHGAVEKGIYLQPCNDARDIIEDEHLKERGYWLEVDYPEWGLTLPYSDPCHGMDPSPDKVYRRAPRLGKHNVDVYCGELGLSIAELNRLSEEGVI